LSETCRVTFQNKFEKLVHLVGFIIRICHDVRSHERKIRATVDLCAHGADIKILTEEFS